jgi:hypothetical protein
MQRYTIIFITINALPVSGGSSAHHQELKTVYAASGVFVELFLFLAAIVSELEMQLQFQLTHDSGKKQKNSTDTPDAGFTVLSS